jgi:hypothetical protein
MRPVISNMSTVQSIVGMHDREASPNNELVLDLPPHPSRDSQQEENP